MSRHLKQVSLLILWGFLMSFPLFTHAAEDPGALTFVIKDQKTDRPLPTVQITLTERETNSTRSVETDSQGRVVVEELDPGLDSVSVAKHGFAPAYEPSIRVITRKNVKVEFALVEQAIERLLIQGQRAEAYGSGSSTYIDREALRAMKWVTTVRAVSPKTVPCWFLPENSISVSYLKPLKNWISVSRYCATLS